MEKKIIFLYTLLSIFIATANSQTNFSIRVEPYSIPGLPGLQSFAAAQYDGKWVLIGGRTDGLHLRQPNSSFSSSFNNSDIYVVDPITKTVWSVSVNSLAASLREQLQSTNMSFCSDGDKFYLVGGYGYSATSNNHKTYSSLVVIDLPGLINAVTNNTAIAPYFRQLNDALFAITGGQLAKLGNMFLLVGGQKFDGRYNPNNGGSFTQTYSNQIRKFKLADDGFNLSILSQSAITDINQLHRRDYNMLPQVFPDGRLGYTAFSGVFQAAANLPFLNTVDIDTVTYTPNITFNQLLNHYHSGKLSLYDAAANAMHSIFFGGMAQYYYDAGGNLIQDNQVPFVSTIGKVTRAAYGSMTESKIGDLSGLIGSGAELLVNHSLPLYANEVIKINDIPQDTVLAGYLVGGIQSTAPNIFNINTGTQSVASNAVYSIYLVKTAVLPVTFLYFRGNKQHAGILLEWKTATEINHSRFELEHSVDGNIFTSINTQPGSGNSIYEKTYSYLHRSPAQGINYYRLKTVSTDGKIAYSFIVLVKYETAEDGLLIYPNPVRDNLVVEFSQTTSGKANIKIFDEAGRQLLSQEVNSITRQLFINTSSLPKGGYFLKISVKEKNYSQHFIKE